MINLLEKPKVFVQKHIKALGTVAGAISGLALAPFAHATAFDTMISDAGTQFSTTTGFTYAELVTKVGTWIKMFLGGGLGLVDALIGWIIALIIFGVIVALLFRAMRFLHILR